MEKTSYHQVADYLNYLRHPEFLPERETYRLDSISLRFAGGLSFVLPNGEAVELVPGKDVTTAGCELDGSNGAIIVTKVADELDERGYFLHIDDESEYIWATKQP